MLRDTTIAQEQGSQTFSLRDFTYDLPPALIAQEPLAERSAARLLYRSRAGTYADHVVADLPSLLSPGSLLVVNDSRVIASRLQGVFASGGRCEIFLLEKPQGNTRAVVECFASPRRKLRLGREIFFAAGLTAQVEALNNGSGASSPSVRIAFHCSGDELCRWLAEHAYVPLPPYIKRISPQPAGKSPDTMRYQTVYAGRTEGSVAAPTAGLHFDAEVLARLAAQQISLAPVTLHVGAGTFLPVKDEELARHTMHRERFCVPAETLTAIINARREGRPVIFVGTTSLRCLESLYQQAGGCEDRMRERCDVWQETDLFIYPRTSEDRYRPWAATALLTNFHQPASTLYMLVCALFGYREMAEHYRYAIDQGYRFLSYGDTSLIELP